MFRSGAPEMFVLVCLQMKYSRHSDMATLNICQSIMYCAIDSNLEELINCLIPKQSDSFWRLHLVKIVSNGPDVNPGSASLLERRAMFVGNLLLVHR